jgi:hypothetical protein
MSNEPTNATKKVAIGDIAKLEIPAGLAYALALERIKREATGTGVTIDLVSFYSEIPVELHNFVSKITYRFIDSHSQKIIAYQIEDSDFYSCNYREIDYAGQTIREIPESLCGRRDKSQEEVENIRYANSVLGIWRSFCS